MIDVVLGAVTAELAAAIIAYAVYRYLKPLRSQHSGIGVAFAALAILWLIKTISLHWFTGFDFDIDQFRKWALRIASDGPARFYGPGYSFDPNYAPVAIYALWPGGALGHVLKLSWDNLRFPVETPVLVADFVVAITMFGYLRRSGRSLMIAWTGTLLAALNPALLFDSVVWGQSDSIVSALMWLATLTILDGEYILAAVVLALAVQTKPHALILMPLLFFWVWRKSGFARLWAPAGAFLAATIIVAAPFAMGRPWDWLPRFYFGGLASFPETSANAFNLMAIAGGLRQAETATIFGVSDFAVGMTLFLAVLVLSCVQIWRKPFPASLMLAIFLALFGEFIFAPRMHERYLFPAMVFFAPVAIEGLFWMAAFVLLTLNWLFNLAYVFHILHTVFWLDANDGPAMLSAALNLILFGALLARITSLQPAEPLHEAPAHDVRSPALEPSG